MIRGGSYYYGYTHLDASDRRSADVTNTTGYYGIGFRVASIPEPGSLAMLFAGAASLLAYAWRRHRA